MPSLLEMLPDGATFGSKHVLTAAVLVSGIVSLMGTSSKHSLTTSALCWTAICTYTCVRFGTQGMRASTRARTLSWSVGTLLAIAGICERAADRHDLWWAKALIPAFTYTMLKTDIAGGGPTARRSAVASPSIVQKTSSGVYGSTSLLLLITISASIAASNGYCSAAVLALGCCNALLVATSMVLLQDAHKESIVEDESRGNVVSVNGFLGQPAPMRAHSQEIVMVVFRDVSMAATLLLWSAAIFLEDMTFSRLRYGPEIAKITKGESVMGQRTGIITYALLMVLANTILRACLMMMILQQGALSASFALLSSLLCTQLAASFALPRLWFAAVCVTCLALFLDDRAPAGSGSGSGYFPAIDDRRKMRVKRFVSLLGAVSCTVVATLYLRERILGIGTSLYPPQLYGPTIALPGDAPTEASKPLDFLNPRVHPIDQLVRDGEAEFMQLLERQSQTLEQAVAEYKRRYRIPPPPHFDKWYALAKKRGVQLIDEYDTIYHSLLPFWALRPDTIRARVREAIGFDGNNLIGLLIRDGQARHIHGGQQWQQEATIGMMEHFMRYLPDMDLAFNIHDEPRVVVPHDELSRLIALATDRNMPAALANPEPRNSFSQRPKDLSNGQRVDEVKTTKFNVFAHQPTWIPSRMSCSPDSPARALDDSTASDNLTTYALSDLGFVYNQTAFSDVCNSPSFATSHGFFDRPNAFNVVHDLYPVFSQSKMSSFQDIVYPSPWYWYGKVAYDEAKDMEYSAKEDKLWWVGSTTGGFSRDGGWRRQHRQQMVRKLNALDSAKIYRNKNMRSDTKDSEQPVPDWEIAEVPRQDYKNIIDVHFSHVGQCDPGDCDAQREFFSIVPPADQQAAWRYKYLLDLDGNAFSGRFYAFLKSHSMVFKMAVFREWHAEWLRPWVHFIPLSLRGDDALEAVRYFSQEEEGKAQAVRMAQAGRDWANKVLRNEDFEVWFFRLMLEYGRVIDDARESIGYDGP